MGDRSRIEWTEATWNPVRARNRETGGNGHFCVHVSEGCRNCYAERMQPRFRNPIRYAAQDRAKVEIVLDDKMLTDPLRWRRPRMIFVCSMTDLFADFVTDAMIDKVFAVMALCPQHTFQVLTKRPERMRAWASDPRTPFRIARAAVDLWTDGAVDAPLMGATWPVRSIGDDAFDPDDIVLECWPLPNVWAGTSAEDQDTAAARIPELLATPAAVRWISAEPLLGAVDVYGGDPDPRLGGVEAGPGLSLGQWWRHDDPPGSPPRPGLDWVVCGGESGSKARPMHPDWARSLREQCKAAGVPFFFKQWGEWLPVGQTLPGHGKVHGATAVRPGRMKLHYGGTPMQAPRHAFAERGVNFASTADGRLTFRVGKKAAGRLLDGVEHNGFPEVRP